MNKKLLLLICFLLSVICNLQPASAAIPSGYYASIDGKTGEAIREALHTIIDNHTVVNYSSLESYYAQTDVQGDTVLDIYSKCRFTMSDGNCSQSHVCDCWNKEHTVPQSYFKEASPMKSDLFHVLPTDARVNNMRGNSPYGETSSTAYIDNNPSALGHIGTSSLPGCTCTVYEPDDEYKGDLARIYFYMITRYLTTNFTQADPAKVTFTYVEGKAGLTPYGVNLLLKWHRQDPVSVKEIKRNEAVFGIQNNRNPYVDYPCLVEYIWGDNEAYMGQKLDLASLLSTEDSAAFFTSDKTGCDCITDKPLLRQPKAGTVVKMDTTAVDESVYQDLTVSGVNLTQPVTLALQGADAALFSLSTTTLSASELNQSTSLRITYTPTVIGHHEATLSFSSSEFNTRTITLKGDCGFVIYPPVPDPSTQSVELRWSDAGVASYAVDVFFLQTERKDSVTILNSDAGTGADTGGFTEVKNGYIRLGSGSTGGSITYDNLDLTEGGNVFVIAKAYNATDHPQMKVTVADQSSSVEPTTSDSLYVFPVAEGSSAQAVVRIETTNKNQRVWIKNVSVKTGGTKEVRDHLPGYPVSVMSLNHVVANVLPDTSYCYTLTPDGLPESAIHKFLLKKATALEQILSPHSALDASKFLFNGHLYLRRDDHIYDALGRMLE